MVMQFGRDERTGQMGYWDGTKFVPLQPGKVSQPQGNDVNIADLARQPSAGVKFDNISQADQRAVQDAMKRGQTVQTPKLPSAPIPSARAAELQQGEAIASEARRDPQYLAETQQAGKESLPELLKFAASNVAPTVLSGGTNVAASGLIRGGGLLARLARMAVAGSGGYAGEKINQAVGLTPEDDANAAISGGISALPGFFRPAAKELTSTQKTVRRLAGGGEASAKYRVADDLSDKLYKVARAGEDINSEKLLQPLTDAIGKERNTPNFDRNIVTSLENLRESLTKHVVDIQNRIKLRTQGNATLEPPVGVPTKPAGKEVASTLEQVPGKEKGKEVSTALRTPFAKLFEKAKEAAGVGAKAGGVGGLEVGQTTVGAVRETGKQVAAENIVDDLKQLKTLAETAENNGRTDLAKSIRDTYKTMAAEVPYLQEADVVYGQSKGLQRGAKAIRNQGSKGIANLLDDPKLSGSLTPDQKAFLMKQAAQSDDIGRITQSLLQNPLGRAMIRAGITEKGVVKPGLWSAALQVGARMAGLGQE